jgi:hypothetical protein
VKWSSGMSDAARFSEAATSITSFERPSKEDASRLLVRTRGCRSMTNGREKSRNGCGTSPIIFSRLPAGVRFGTSCVDTSASRSRNWPGSGSGRVLALVVCATGKDRRVAPPPN